MLVRQRTYTLGRKRTLYTWQTKDIHTFLKKKKKTKTARAKVKKKKTVLTFKGGKIRKTAEHQIDSPKQKHI